MSTIAIHQQRTLRRALPHYNYYAWLSGIGAALFILFIGFSMLGHSPSGFLSILFIVIMPSLAFILSAIAVTDTSINSRDLMISYAALGVTSLYFMVALAVPFVLVGCYILYTFIL